MSSLHFSQRHEPHSSYHRFLYGDLCDDFQRDLRDFFRGGPGGEGVEGTCPPDDSAPDEEMT
jgi:hypothetical protein